MKEHVAAMKKKQEHLPYLNTQSSRFFKSEVENVQKPRVAKSTRRNQQGKQTSDPTIFDHPQLIRPSFCDMSSTATSKMFDSRSVPKQRMNETARLYANAFLGGNMEVIQESMKNLAS